MWRRIDDSGYIQKGVSALDSAIKAWHKFGSKDPVSPATIVASLVMHHGNIDRLFKDPITLVPTSTRSGKSKSKAAGIVRVPITLRDTLLRLLKGTNLAPCA